MDTDSLKGITFNFYFNAPAGYSNKLGLRCDIAQKYGTDGFNKVFEMDDSEFRTLLRNAFATDLGTLAGNGEHQYQLQVSLPAASGLAAGEMLRMDLMLDSRTSYAPYLDLMNTPPGITWGAGDYSFDGMAVTGRDDYLTRSTMENGVAVWSDYPPEWSTIPVYASGVLVTGVEP